MGMSFKDIPLKTPIINIMNKELIEFKKVARKEIAAGAGPCRKKAKHPTFYCPSYIPRTKMTGFPTPYPNRFGESVIHILQIYSSISTPLTYNDIIQYLNGIPPYSSVKSQWEHSAIQH